MRDYFVAALLTLTKGKVRLLTTTVGRVGLRATTTEDVRLVAEECSARN
jgi:hypothetical protein